MVLPKEHDSLASCSFHTSLCIFISKRTFKFGARIWNSISQSIPVLPTHKFKASLHQLYLSILKLEDTYVDTSTLVDIDCKMREDVL